MFKNILVATDGADLDQRVAKFALELAQIHSAHVIFAYIIYPYSVADIDFPIPTSILPTHADYERACRGKVLQVFGPIELLAKQTPVSFETTTLEHAQTWRGILQIAQDKHCDLICMSSHGRSGLSALLLGSETQKVLAHSQLPVLVVR